MKKTMLMETLHGDLRMTINSLIFWKHKCLLQKLTVLVNVDSCSSKAGWGDFCSSPKGQHVHLLFEKLHIRAMSPITILQCVWLPWELPSGDARCRLVWEEKQMARLGWESSRRLCLCTVWWYTCVGLAVMRTPHSHSL